ncbi:hypothetical protein [Acinetobacter sp. ASP199]|uniref:hypothetical protein n=1 Tax=unclassified Acinetobacter TaxID=196816 RepID=UPI001F6242CC|nr:hypothetical protein [Acinetobacter sp. ASP199]UNT59200.1 hypothetical protein IHE35_14225 [Acinetobacter sp. ASP199]
MTENAIVVITYNRLVSLKRLIKSLLCAEYSGDQIDLIVSMDCSGDRDLELYIESISWPFGEIVKVFHEEKLGLKKHVLFCGSFTKKYENLYIFEDDLYVSKGFYAYGKGAIDFYKDDERIAGISLYQYEWNQYANLRFDPIHDEYDTYFLQVASSWGQIWNRKKWNAFIEWMQNYCDEDLKNIEDLPAVVSSWSKNSWLKFHHAYLVVENKYFVYPRVALSTNFSEPGQHALLDSTYQVNLLHGVKNNYRFPTLENGIKYDGYFENKEIFINGYENVTVDLYGTKKIKRDYFLSTIILPYKVEKSFALRLRPWELNIINEVSGEGVYLYKKDNNKLSFLKHNYLEALRRRYLFKINTRKGLFVIWVSLIFESLMRRLKK